MSNRCNVLATLKAWSWLSALTLLSCTSSDGDTTGVDESNVRVVRQAITDTDSDGMDDGFETTYFGNLSRDGSGDFDSDGMTDLEEYTGGLNPTVNDALDDADGDRYPNIFEVKRSSDPNDAGSTPTPNYTVDTTGSGTHTNVSAAVGAANITNGDYQIIGIAPGIYTGSSNLDAVSLTTSKPKFLIIGLQGADKTVLEGTGSNMGWTISNTAVVAGLTFRKNMTPFYLNGSSKEVRLVDLFIKDNPGGATASFAHMPGGSSVTLKVSGTTILNNAGIGALEMWVGSGSTATLTNTVFWGSQTWTLIGTGGSTLTSSYSLVKGATLTGTGNLAGSVNPKLNSDGHLLWDSPLRGAGGPTTMSRTDMDGEVRPTGTPDIGVDQFVDSDSDQLADQWELANAGNLTTLTGRSQDADSDGLSNEGEYENLTNPIVADSDGDTVSDGDEVNIYGSNPLATDTDADDMPDGWEVAHGISPTLANRFDDDDGDGYPNVFEYARSSDPSSSSSIPSPNYVVDGAGGGTHTTISAAVNATNVANGAYQIIGVAPGVYTDSANLDSVSLTTSKPKLLIIGLQGAGKTIFDGNRVSYGWNIASTAVIASLTFRNTMRALYITAASQEVRLVDLLFQENGVGQTTYSGGIHVVTSYPVSLKIVGSTFLNNSGGSYGEQIWFGEGDLTLQNTAIWGTSTGLLLGNRTGTTVTASYSLVKGQTLTGTGNLAGTVDPGLRSDAHLRSDSPLRAAGGTISQSRLDIDGELRPGTAPDIGVDQFNDADLDDLPDTYEVAVFGNITAIDGAEDEDLDGLTNSEEYDLESDLFDPDTDGDGVDDGLEVAIGTNPTSADSDDLAGDLNHDGLIDSVSVQLGHQPNDMDNDGDGVSNADELLMCTDPLRSDTDGDGVADDTDAFPHDPLMSSLISDPEDVTAPVITLESPWYAVEQ